MGQTLVYSLYNAKGFFFGQFCDNHPQEDFVKFGYKLDIDI
jgi:hypothetical protein